MGNLGFFLAALAIAYLVPGPDMLLVLQTGAVKGRNCAMAAAAGLAMARATHVTLAACGLAALFAASPAAFQAARLLGAAYLLWLGLGILRAGPWASSPTPDGNDGGAASVMHALRRGLLTNLLNPKALLFSSMLLPQFILPGNGGMAAAFFRLGLILVAVGIAFDSLFILVGGRLGLWLRDHPRAAQTQQWSFALLLMGFGLRLGLGG